MVICDRGRHELPAARLGRYGCLPCRVDHQTSAIIVSVRRADPAVEISAVEEHLRSVHVNSLHALHVQVQQRPDLFTSPWGVTAGAVRFLDYLHTLNPDGPIPAALCGKCRERPVTVNSPPREGFGLICLSCNRADHTGTCTHCSRQRPLMHRSTDGDLICANCFRYDDDRACASCGRTAQIQDNLGASLCHNCRRIIANGNAQVSACAGCGKPNLTFVREARPDALAVIATSSADCAPVDEGPLCKHCAEAALFEWASHTHPGLARADVEKSYARLRDRFDVRRAIAEAVLGPGDVLRVATGHRTGLVHDFVNDLRRGCPSIPAWRCSACDKTGLKEADKGLCSYCELLDRAEVCPYCDDDEPRPYAYRRDDGAAVCRYHYDKFHKQPEQCARCGKSRPLKSSRMCGPCTTTVYQATNARRECARCDDPAAVNANWPEGPICTRCYRRTAWALGPCTQCGQWRQLPGNVAGVPALCAPCAGIPMNTRCEACGLERGRFRAGQCLHCTNHQQLLDLFGVDSPLEHLRDLLEQSSNPNAVNQWLRNSPATRCARAIVNGDVLLTHEGLDDWERQLGQVGQHPLRIFRSWLIAAGLLEYRNEQIAYTERQLTEELNELNSVSDADRKTLGAYLRFHVLRRLNQLDEVDRSAGEGARRQWRVAAAFVAAVGEKGMDLGSVAQATLDRHLSVLPTSQRSQLASFLRWARHRRLLAGVTWPRIAEHDPLHERPEDNEAHEMISRLLQDERLHIHVRAAGLLMLLFGLRLTTILSLDQSDLIIDLLPDGTTEMWLRVDTEPIYLSPELASILHRLNEHATAQNKPHVLDPVPSGPNRPAKQSHRQGDVSEALFMSEQTCKRIGPKSLTRQIKHSLGLSIPELRTWGQITLARSVSHDAIGSCTDITKDTAWRIRLQDNAAAWAAVIERESHR